MEPASTELSIPPSVSVLRLAAPARDEIEALAVSRRAVPWTYDPVGYTRDETVPEGFRQSEVRGMLGRGEAAFHRARSAVDGYEMFRLPWVRLRLPDTPPAPDLVVAFASHQWGVWAINVCRIVYVLDSDDGRIARYGFGYGTVRPHAVEGEERFAVCWDRESDEVWFDIWKFSRPAHPLVRMAGPLGRMTQRRFDQGALAAMRAAVEEEP